MSQSVTILLVDDDDLDVKGVKRAFRKAKVKNDLVVACNGLDAFDCLRGTNGRDRIEPPLMILLDINMPRMDGLEFLDVLRQDSALHHHVVFVLTTSEDDKDRTAAYQRHIAGYVTKRNAGVDFMNMIRLLDDYGQMVVLGD